MQNNHVPLAMAASACPTAKENSSVHSRQELAMFGADAFDMLGTDSNSPEKLMPDLVNVAVDNSKWRRGRSFPN
jgi:hypothetical protein